MTDNQIVTQSTNWRFTTDQSNFERLKSDRNFWSVVALSRVVNALRFVQMPLLDNQGKNSPSAIRARFNSFFFSSSLFYEASLFVPNLSSPLRTMPEFQAMAEVINRKQARSLRDTNLDNLRNKLVFHVDIDEIGKRLQGLKYPVFLTATGRTNAEVYYEIADVCAHEAFKEQTEMTDEDSTNLVGRAADLMLAFMDAAELFIKKYLETEGWRPEIVAQPHYSL